MKMNKKVTLYVTIGTLLMLLLGIVYSYSMFRLEIESMYDVDSVLSGIPYMLVLAFYSLFMMIGGILYSRYSTLKVALTGTLLVGGGFILASLTTSILGIALTYGVLIGTGIGILYGLPLRIVSQMNYPKIGFLTGITLLGFGVSPLIFAPLINNLISSNGLNHTFLVLGLLYFAFVLPLVFLLVRQDEVEKVKSKLSYPVLKNKKFLTLYFLFFLSTFIGLSVIGLTGNIGTELIGLTEAKVALFVGIFAIFNGVGRPLFGYINDKIGFKKAAIYSFSSMILFGVLSFIFSNSIFIFVGGFIVFYLNFGGWLSLAPSATISLFGKKDYSKNYGLMFTAYGVGAIVGTLVSGYIVELFNLSALFIVIAILAAIGITFVHFTFKEEA